MVFSLSSASNAMNYVFATILCNFISYHLCLLHIFNHPTTSRTKKIIVDQRTFHTKNKKIYTNDIKAYLNSYEI